MNQTNQLHLFSLPAAPATFDRNTLNGTSGVKPRPQVRRRDAGQALSERIVDDRVFSMGMTNWKAVIDRALSMGHVELFNSENSRQGLRRPGYRYAPIPLLPDRGAEYIKTRTLEIGAEKLSRKSIDKLSAATKVADLAITVKPSKTGLLIILESTIGKMDIKAEYSAFRFADDSDGDVKKLGASLALMVASAQASSPNPIQVSKAQAGMAVKLVLRVISGVQELSA